jgi:nicotinate-nucleotide pyrophosphorylase (carboxylating)
MLTAATIDAALRLALDEDAPWGDITGEAFIPADRLGAGRAARTGGRGARRHRGLRPRLHPLRSVGRGRPRTPPTATPSRPVRLLATVAGPARDGAAGRADRPELLPADERHRVPVTRRVSSMPPPVVPASPTPARPHRVLRAFEKHAVVCGGGHNHRFGLSDAVMAKDNHLAVLAGEGRSVAEAIRRRPQPACRTRRGSRSRSTASTRCPDGARRRGRHHHARQLHHRPSCARASTSSAGRAVVEASGNVTLDTIPEIAATGVDVISSGALTHSVRSIDLGLDLVLTSPAGN